MILGVDFIEQSLLRKIVFHYHVFQHLLNLFPALICSQRRKLAYIQYSQRGTYIILGHAKIVSTRLPRRVFMQCIAEARSIDLRKDTESILTSCTLAE